MAHALVLSAAHDARRAASYATCFDIAWKLGIQPAYRDLQLGPVRVPVRNGSMFGGADVEQLNATCH